MLETIMIILNLSSAVYDQTYEVGNHVFHLIIEIARQLICIIIRNAECA